MRVPVVVVWATPVNESENGETQITARRWWQENGDKLKLEPQQKMKGRMKKLIAAVVFVALALASCVLSGCGSTPTAFEQKFFDITTNYTPQITIHTNTVTFTNVVQREQWTTNVVNDVKHITITPVREVTLKDVAV